jgi:hypothetical protein
MDDFHEREGNGKHVLCTYDRVLSFRQERAVSHISSSLFLLSWTGLYLVFPSHVCKWLPSLSSCHCCERAVHSFVASCLLAQTVTFNLSTPEFLVTTFHATWPRPVQSFHFRRWQHQVPLKHWYPPTQQSWRPRSEQSQLWRPGSLQLSLLCDADVYHLYFQHCWLKDISRQVSLLNLQAFRWHMIVSCCVIITQNSILFIVSSTNLWLFVILSGTVRVAFKLEV